MGILCSGCGGEGSEWKVETREIKIPLGTVDGQCLREEGLGCAGMNHGEKGDLMVKVGVLEDEYF